MIGKVKRLKYDGKAKALKSFGRTMLVTKGELLDYKQTTNEVTLYRQDIAVMTFYSTYVRSYFDMYPYDEPEAVEEIKGLDEFLQASLLQNNINYALDQGDQALFLAITNKRSRADES